MLYVESTSLSFCMLERPIITGVIGAETMSGIEVRQTDSGPWAGPTRNGLSFMLPNMQTPGPRRTPPATGEQPGTDRFSFAMPTPTYPGPGGQPPGAGARPVTLVNDRYTFGIPDPADPGPARQSAGTYSWRLKH